MSSESAAVIADLGSDVVFYNPAEGHGLPHDPFKAIVAPRMIAWISTTSSDGQLNLAPYACRATDLARGLPRRLRADG
jgi:hypothetical protein